MLNNFKEAIQKLVTQEVEKQVGEKMKEQFKETSLNEIKKILEVYDNVIDQKIADHFQEHFRFISSYLLKEENDTYDETN